MNKLHLLTGSFFGATSIILGAFAAHFLLARVSMQELSVFETGTRYQMYHALALLLVGVLHQFLPHKIRKVIIICFSMGIFLFSGSLYLLSTKQLLGIESWRWLGPITPIGGLCFIVGWIMIGLGVFSNNKAKLQ